MPELPEVEVTRLGVVELLRGALVHSVKMGKPLRWPLGARESRLQGLQIKDIARRGKYLLVHCEPEVLLVHLGMSGSLRLVPFGEPYSARTHDHFVMQTSRGTLVLNDPRRFGAVVFAKNAQAPIVKKLLGKLGVEPLSEDFTPTLLYKALKSRKTSIKQALLGGTIVVGVGNIYASESLFLAKIRPTRISAKLTQRQCSALCSAVKAILSRAIEAGGSTLQNFSNPLGESGYFQLESRVYDRAGEPCRVCRSPIKHIVQSNRSSYYCAVCQT